MRATMFAMMRGEDIDGGRSRVNVEIRRDYLYQDSLQQLNQLGPKLNKKGQGFLYQATRNTGGDED
jgi:hypothetical protein